jgi:prepilin-type N-terminal cleavage/methylation domain-containing protein
MKTVLSHCSLLGSSGTKRRAGVTLLEVLVAIFVMGIGLLALLTLFPLGAISMAGAIQDDRAAHIAQDAMSLSQTGEDVLRQTGVFVAVSLNNTSADPKTILELRTKYEGLVLQAAHLEGQLQQLRRGLTSLKDKRKVDLLLAQIRAIKQGFYTIVQLLLMLENGGTGVSIHPSSISVRTPRLQHLRQEQAWTLSGEGRVGG